MIGILEDLTAATTVYTDGSCIKNPGGPGGWAYYAYGDLLGSLVKYTSESYYNDSGAVQATTNNRMELFAIFQGLAAGYDKGYRKIKIVTDSKYCIHALSNYETWLANGSAGNRKNMDLIQIFDFYTAPDVLIEFQWVKGHAKDAWNNLVDSAAYEAAKNETRKVDIGYESLQQQKT